MPRFQKGSPEALNWGKKMQEAKLKKKQVSGGSMMTYMKDSTKNATDYMFKGKINYPVAMKAVLRQHGNQPIVQMFINRQPFTSTLNRLLNVVSGNTFYDNLKNSPYDSLFHLRCICVLQNGARVSFEKEATIKLNIFRDKNMNSDGAETVEVSNPPNVTLLELVQNTERLMGGRFFTYSASHNNCQDMLIAMCQANGISNQYADFIKQDIKFVFENNSFLRKIAHSATNLGRASAQMTGQGIKKRVNRNVIIDL